MRGYDLPPELEDEVSAIKAEIAQIGVVLKGSLKQRTTVCSKKGCGCRSDPELRHGPYWDHTCKVDGKTQTKRLTDAQAQCSGQWVDDRKRLQALVERWLEIGSMAFGQLVDGSSDRSPPVETPDGSDGREAAMWASLLELAERRHHLETLGRKWPSVLHPIDSETIGIQRLRSRGGAAPGTAKLSRSDFIHRWRILARDGYADETNWPWTLSIVWTLFAHLPPVFYNGAFDLRLSSADSHPMGEPTTVNEQDGRSPGIATEKRGRQPDTAPEPAEVSLPVEMGTVGSEPVQQVDRESIARALMEGFPQPRHLEQPCRPELDSWDVESVYSRFLESDPNAYLFFALFTRNSRWQRACRAPQELASRLGEDRLPVREIAGMNLDDLEPLIAGSQQRGESRLHRFPRVLAGAVIRASQRLVSEYEADASRIWSASTPMHAADVGRRLRTFHGVGQKIQCMVLRHLITYYGVPLRGWDSIDVAVDRHVARVFLRTGLIDIRVDGRTRISTGELVWPTVQAARQSSPAFPAALDEPAWSLGLSHCKGTRPLCHTCKISELCGRRHLSVRVG